MGFSTLLHTLLSICALATAQQPLIYEPAYGRLGDWLLSVVGFAALSRLRGRLPIVQWQRVDTVHQDGGYATFLFALDEIVMTDQPVGAGIDRYSTFRPGYGFSPFFVRAAAKAANVSASLADVSAAFRRAAWHVRPSRAVLRALPPGLEAAVGVHLRRSDKVKVLEASGGKMPEEVGWEQTPADFDTITRHVRAHLLALLEERPEAAFYLASEDTGWRAEFASFIANASRGRATVLPPASAGEGSGFAAAADLFALSRCASVVQGVKHSSFSLAAALVGDVPLVNFGAQVAGWDRNLVRLYAPVVRLHGGAVDPDEVALEAVAQHYARSGMPALQAAT